MWIFNNLKSPNLQFDTIKKYRLAIALISGILMALATAPVSAWPLAWLALAPLWVMIASYEKPTAEEKKQKFFLLPSSFFLLPSLWGIGYHGLALSWIMGIHPMTWLGVPWWPSLAIALFCWAFITLWGAALVAIWAWLFIIIDLTPLAQEAGGRKSQFSCLIRVLIGTAVWCILEYIWSSGSLWWTSLSYTQSPHNLAILHLGQLSGPSAITAAIVAVNGLIAEAWSEGRRKREEGRRGNLISYLLPVIFCLILHIVGFSLYSNPLTEDAKSELKIGIIQGNIPNEIKFNSEGWIRSLEGYTTGYKNLANQGVDAVLIPETALPFVWTNPNQRFYLSLYQAILAQKVVAWVGGFGQQEDSITNSLFTINGNGEIVSRYDKTKLVPLGEYIPFEQFIGSIINRLSPLDSHLVAGKSNQLFDTPFGRAIVGICYDSAFTEHFRRQAAMGGEFILTASNDAHYNSSMMAQHHAQDLMRGIETDRWVVRATNTGYSAFVNPHGETLWISGVNTYEVQAGNIYRRKTQTLYVRWGDWLTPLLLVLGVIAKVFQRG
ncbi:apolipoprotein N-acyltransferase [Kamptonema animale CS-326]|jgi:apolipoprotein N-acyltransferase|uniref:apolipoprotein N-acyltransferase n=1 Tax=Kamptonema animale TaxID=92934 RepID=UPI00232DE6A3|nr:apolipoprotein N-acyltransferase [Kamptonema animale]MDB9510960.1 apolipoprotein N-acyltransferase [Kamptonema animale CS-326]